MATEILRPQDCLRPQSLYESVSSPRPFYNRRKLAPVRPIQQTPSPNSKPKQGRQSYNKSTRKSSSPSPSTSPPSTSPLSTSHVPDGFRLLKRGEALALRSGQPGLEKGSPVETKQKHGRQEQEKLPSLRRSEPPPSTRFEKSTPSPPRKKHPSDRALPQLTTPPAKPIHAGSVTGSIFAGPNFAICAPEASSLPQPMYLLRSTSVGPTSDDEASRALRSLLKLQFL